MRIESDDRTYIDWKNWAGGSEFGGLAKGDAAVFQRMVALAKQGGSRLNVLEIGFGEGRFLNFCKQQGHDISGYEINDLLMNAARDAGYNVVEWTDIAARCEASFDLIAAFDVLEHIPTNEIGNWLDQLKGLLKPDGRLLFRFPNGDSWQGLVNFNGDPTHVTAVGYFKLKYFADAAGFDLVEFVGEQPRGFETSVKHGLHRLLSTPFRYLSETLTKMLYFPGSPVVLGSKNVLAVLAPKAASTDS